MPIKTCLEQGKPGYKYGDSGKCYTYNRKSKSSKAAAKRKTVLQMRAMYANGYTPQTSR